LRRIGSIPFDIKWENLSWNRHIFVTLTISRREERLGGAKSASIDMRYIWSAIDSVKRVRLFLL
jgi:hypothetical protein